MAEKILIKKCSVDQCEGKYLAKGFCGKHYKRVREGKNVLKSYDVVDSTPEIKFWNRIDIKGEQDCWEWQKGCFATGYGQVHWQGKSKKAHRIAYTLAIGEIPENALILHSCDNPKCCNPHHLRIGNHQENMDDKLNRNRQPNGEQINFAKLSEKDIVEIFELRAQRQTLKEIALKFDVSFGLIGHILRGKTWKHLNLSDVTNL